MMGYQENQRYVTAQELIYLHDEIIRETGGEGGLLNRGNIEFIVDFIQRPIYAIKMTGVFDIAAGIMQGIISGHPFVDGNKRAGISSAQLFLRKNGYDLHIKTKEGVKFAIEVALDKKQKDEIRAWIEEHSTKI